jgi:enterochelin esterase-like enzyme
VPFEDDGVELDHAASAAFVAALGGAAGVDRTGIGRLPDAMTAALRILWASAALSAALAAAAVAQSGRVLENESFQSPTLGRAWSYAVYLPPDYATSERAYPVVYLLHGLYGSHTDWIRYDDAAAIADDLIATREIPPLILVMPEGGDSWWIDSDPKTGFGPVETALLHDLVPHVEATYRTIPERRERAIAGLSMGGYGALRLAFEHPELFGAVAGISPAIQRSAEGFGLKSPAFGSPFDPARFAAAEPWSYLPALASQSAKLPLHVWLTIGDDDEFPLFLDGTMDLYLALRAAKVPAELRVVDGHHNSSFWSAALRDVLPYFGKVFEARRL